MKKLFVFAALISPMAAHALDTAGCDTIGYWQSTDTTCYMYDECVKSITENPENNHDPEVACGGQPRTEDECVRQLAQNNADFAEYDLLIKCPVTDARLTQKNSNKDFNPGGKFVSVSGDDIDVDALIADTDNVYYAKIAFGLTAIVNPNAPWRVIGPRDEDGLYMMYVE